MVGHQLLRVHFTVKIKYFGNYGIVIFTCVTKMADPGVGTGLNHRFIINLQDITDLDVNNIIFKRFIPWYVNTQDTIVDVTYP